MKSGPTRSAVLLTLVAVGVPLPCHAQEQAMAKAAAIVATGTQHPDLASFDRLMATFVAKHKVPGAALAVTKGSRLVYARGFGYADTTRKQPVQPTVLFRIASISKPVTAVAVLQLVEKGKLKLSDKVLDILKVEPHLLDGARIDPRLSKVTISHLLHHTGGWDRAKSFDPMFRSIDIAKALGVAPPAEPEHIVRYMMGVPLDCDPGTRYAYSNFGYCLLGRVIEAVAKQPYQEYVRKSVLAPLGITRMRLGRTLVGGRAAGEVRYYDEKGRSGPAVVGKPLGRQVPTPYGTGYLEAMDSHGGWIASAIDLVRFACAFDEPPRCKVLGRKSIATMFARPKGLAGHDAKGKPKAAYYGCGWSVRPVGRRANHWHTGGFGGTSTLLVRRHDGLNWAVLFNTHASGGKALAGLIDPLVHKAANAVKHWPAIDLFAEYR